MKTKKKVIWSSLTIFILISITLVVGNADIWGRILNYDKTGTSYISIEHSGSDGYLNTSLGDINLNPNSNIVHFNNNNVTNITALILTNGQPISWNVDDYTLDIVTGLGNTIQVGQEITSIAKNVDSMILTNGQIVSLVGSSGDRGLVIRADASNLSIAERLGVVTIDSCTVNAECPITTFGRVRDIDTSAWSPGTLLYLSADGSGNLTSTPPSYPNFRVLIGAVIRQHANDGIVLVSPRISYTDGMTLGDVYIRNNLTVEDNFKLENPVEDDLRFPISTLKTTGIKPPAINDYSFGFDDSTVEEAFITMQFPHTRKDNTTFEPHFHWQSSDTIYGDVVWCISYSCANINSNFSAFTDKCIVDSTVGNVDTHLISPEIEINNTLITSSMCKINIYRNATDSRDNYTADANLIEFDIHVKVEKLGYDV